MLAFAGPASASTPSVSIDPTATASYTTAHVSGEIDSGGMEGYFTFERSTDGGASWSGFAYEGYLPPETGAHEISTDIGGLTPGTNYEIRLTAMVFGEEGGEFISPPPLPEFTTLAVGHPTVTIAQPTQVTGTSAHFSGTIDPEAPPTNPEAFNVEWHFECTPECPEMNPQVLPADSSVHTVEVDATDLIPGTHYEVSLIASNAAGPVTAGPKSFDEPLLPPVVKTAPAHVTTTTAALTGTVNPNGAEATYHFEYGPGFSQSTSPKTIFAGSQPVAVRANLANLTPGTTYPFRLVASNSAGTTEGDADSFTTESDQPQTCPNEGFRTGPSAALPECRAYEMVSPPSLEYGDIDRVPTVSDDGTRLSFFTQVAPDTAKSNLTFSTFAAHRTEAGWQVTDSNVTAGNLPPTILFASVSCYSTDYSKGIIETSASFDEFDQDGGFTDIYLLKTGTGEATWQTFGQPGTVYNGIGFINFVGASPDLSRIYFRDFGGEQLTPDTPEGFGGGIYMRDASGIHLVSLGTDDKPLTGEVVSVGSNCGRPAHGQNHGVSADGSKLFMASSVYGGAIYRRDIDAGKTILIDGSQRSGEQGSPAPDGAFVLATPDGETVYFASGAQLTDKATPAGGLYRYQVGSESLEQVTPDAHNPIFGLQGTFSPSEDGSHIYFSSPRRLAPGSVRNANNLYVWTPGPGSGTVSPEGPSGGTTKFVTALTDGGFARISRDGRFAIIQSHDSIDGAANNGKNAIYEYDDQTGEIACVSCRPNGTPSARDANLADGPEALSPGYGIVPRNVADDGRVFFNSSDKLVPADQTFSQDVYEYDHGRTYLLSAGQGDENPSYLADNSDDGSHVFFLSRSPLLPQDKDAAELDLYDAHAGGGLPTPKPVPPICEGEACRTATSPVPPEAAPTTPNFIGPGNARPKRFRPKHHRRRHHHHHHHRRRHHHHGGGHR